MGGVAGTGWSEREGRKDGKRWAQVVEREWNEGDRTVMARNDQTKPLALLDGPLLMEI